MIALKACLALHVIGESRKLFAGVIGVAPGLQVRFGFIERGQKLGSRAFALFPEQKGFTDGIFPTFQTAALNGLLDESFLIRCEFHFHGFSVWLGGAGVKPAYGWAIPSLGSGGYRPHHLMVFAELLKCVDRNC